MVLADNNRNAATTKNLFTLPPIDPEEIKNPTFAWVG
jgi:hypothetical protein